MVDASVWIVVRMTKRVEAGCRVRLNGARVLRINAQVEVRLPTVLAGCLSDRGFSSFFD